MVILGIDPGYAIVGWGVIGYENNHFKVLDYGAITTPAGMSFSRRLELIYDEAELLMKRYSPQAMSIEKLFFNSNAKTVIDVGQARGVLMLAAQKCGLEVYEYTPLQVKQSVVGYGRAEKKQVQEMTRLILHLSEIPKPDDTADALAMAITFCHTNGNQHLPCACERFAHGKIKGKGAEGSMIYSVTGTLIHMDATTAVVECGGVGFKCLTTLNTLKQLGPAGGKVTLYTYLNVREDALDLFGFFGETELACFKMLISVSGVGPKAALSILSELSPEKLALCIATGDSKFRSNPSPARRAWGRNLRSVWCWSSRISSLRACPNNFLLLSWRRQGLPTRRGRRRRLSALS